MMEWLMNGVFVCFVLGMFYVVFGDRLGLKTWVAAQMEKFKK